MKVKSLVLMALALVLSVGMTSCEDKSQSKEQIQVEKHSSVVIDMKVKHLEGFDQLQTTKWIYDSKGVLAKVVYAYDSLPALGMTKDTLVTTTREGDERDTIVTHPKDYQLYITVSK